MTQTQEAVAAVFAAMTDTEVAQTAAAAMRGEQGADRRTAAMVVAEMVRRGMVSREAVGF